MGLWSQTSTGTLVFHKKVSDPLQLELQAAVNYSAWVLGSQLRSSEKAAKTASFQLQQPLKRKYAHLPCFTKPMACQDHVKSIFPNHGALHVYEAMCSLLQKKCTSEIRIL